MIKITIDGQILEVAEGTTILEAAKKIGIIIPTFCHHELLDIIDGAACRICLVEIEGAKSLAPSCAIPVTDGMVVYTDSESVRSSRRTVLELLLSKHPLDCMTCVQAGKCKLQDYCYQYGVKSANFNNDDEKLDKPIDHTNQFYYYDENKCILCGKCVRVCSQLQQVGAIGLSERGYNTHVAVPFELKIKDSTCVSCGNCVSNCPVGALVPKRKEKFRYWETNKVKTTCSYCGVGCQMDLLVKDNKVVEVQPSDKGLANNGLLCVKGKFGYRFIDHKDRLKTPLIKKEGKFVEATWDEAYDLIASKIKVAKEEFGPDSIAGFSSARCTNEENYLFQKLFRGVISTNNVDHCARLCHASTVAGLATTLGSGAMTNSNFEVLNSEVIFVTGSNTTETHPVIGSHIKQALKRGAKLIVAEPRRIDLAVHSDIFLQITPGTNVALFNGLMNVIIDENLQDKEYIEKNTENYDELVSVMKDYTPERVAEICGIDAEDIRKAARMYASVDKASIFYSMGVTQHSTGTQGVMSISNLALLCGNIGKESAGVNPLRGQNNVQGACDMGALPGDLPGYQKVANPDVINKFQKAWGVELSNKVGLTVTEVMTKGSEGDLKVLYVMGENPMLSDPDINHVKEALEKIDFVVVQDIFLTETAELADVVLPAASFAEKEGTFTNTERRIQRVRKAIDCIGNSKPDWEILMTLMNKLGYDKVYSNASEIMDEIASVTPSYGGISFDRIDQEGLQWPCPDKDHPGTKFLHKDGKFSRGKGLFKPADYIKSAESADKDYPYILTTGRMLYHYHTATMTKRVEGINRLFPHSYMEIHPTTANRLGLEDGSKAKVSSRRGEIITTVTITDKVEEDVVFMPFHFADGAVNYLTNSVVDPTAKIPEFKVSAVKIERIKD
ncbi:formate dehydrogenase subunit alpha [Alkalibaculum sp. M08DMB]|uniref:Formate dehydrogenase subunit alpha n=1 Tax=Alkalibaculum sporogenes TaxID=2655001 RepID=A0A6A7KBB2_9FIRM|nr:formate dehydrogenase subunit alpha [Alkalibaculum sporogenes]MPW26686.1 formate dehydrogenase subunit alpha [Alkalibaculum sporogenes]